MPRKPRMRFSQISRSQSSIDGIDFELAVKWGNRAYYNESLQGTLDGPTFQICERKPDISLIVLSADVVSLTGKKIASRTDVIQSIQGLDVRNLNHHVIGFLVRTIVASGISFRMGFVPLDKILENHREKESHSSVSSWAKGLFSSWGSQAPNTAVPKQDQPAATTSTARLNATEFEKTGRHLQERMEEDPITVLSGMNQQSVRNIVEGNSNAVLCYCGRRIALLCLQFLLSHHGVYDRPEDVELPFSMASRKQDQSYLALLAVCTVICSETARAHKTSKRFHFGLLLSHLRPKHVQYVELILVQSLELIKVTRPSTSPPISPGCHSIFREYLELHYAGSEHKSNAAELLVIRQAFSSTPYSTPQGVGFLCQVLGFARTLLPPSITLDVLTSSLNDLPDLFVDYCCTIAPFFMEDADPMLMYFLTSCNLFAMEQALCGDVSRPRSPASAPQVSSHVTRPVVSNTVQARLLGVWAVATALAQVVGSDLMEVTVELMVPIGAFVADHAEIVTSQVLEICERTLRSTSQNNCFASTGPTQESWKECTKCIQELQIDSNLGSVPTILCKVLKQLLIESSENLIVPAHMCDNLGVTIETSSDLVEQLYLIRNHFLSLSWQRCSVLNSLLFLFQQGVDTLMSTTKSEDVKKVPGKVANNFGDIVLNTSQYLVGDKTSQLAATRKRIHGELLLLLMTHRRYLLEREDVPQLDEASNRILKIVAVPGFSLSEGYVDAKFRTASFDSSTTDGESSTISGKQRDESESSSHVSSDTDEAKEVVLKLNHGELDSQSELERNGVHVDQNDHIERKAKNQFEDVGYNGVERDVSQEIEIDECDEIRNDKSDDMLTGNDKCDDKLTGNDKCDDKLTGNDKCDDKLTGHDENDDLESHEPDAINDTELFTSVHLDIGAILNIE